MDLHPTPNKQHKQGNRMPIDGLISDSKQTNANRKQNANRWTYFRLLTKKGCTNTHTKKKKGFGIYTHQRKERGEHTKKQKGARRDLAQSPAYVSHLV
jgi:hypothetical protein